MGRCRPFVVLTGLAALLSFVMAAMCWPGGGYNPCFKMLSALGRTEVDLVEYPWCYYFFIAGMFLSGASVVLCSCCIRLCVWGAVLNAAGLVTISLVPENVNRLGHDVGCWIAVAGGSAMLFVWLRREQSRAVRIVWSLLLFLSMASLAIGLFCHERYHTPFSPWVPTAQKLVILSFASWLLFMAYCGVGRALAVFVSVLPTAAVASLTLLSACVTGPSPADIMKTEPVVADQPEPRPLSSDELAALAWLEHVTGPLDEAEEREWWNIGGSQHGIFSKRYNIAFAGYAAAAVGMRGDADVRARVGKVLGDCVRRMLDTDVWAYSMSESYWGRKPWAPDPCFRENVMYTGHLLHLLAYYELFSGDRRYHREGGGWDFVWKDGRKVHYDVEKLIAVTVEQMREGPNGGIACELGLMFFACNNHPHVALSVFSKLGYGDWSGDAARWERWALSHYLSPMFGGGAINLVYHVRGNFMYPRGQDGLDGWSLLWYEAWASDRRLATALWRRAREKLYWPRLSECGDERGSSGCCDPQPVPGSVAAAFLAAAARACGDAETAERIEASLDARHLRREGGCYWLGLNREWRIGATAMRIISLAESNGSRFRTLSALPR